ncbi:asparagine synthase-related protein [Deinococcus koreensis]|uniref:asparagine synthase (glutamine-hydrolyzing) n=1 Tax=Deinococcus koreensis TaxID=2054903 RepID=A0A2K3UWL4_9DEIO|nr:asparagine synthase-related protein [Deinococcus koreensis]PNY80928.1 hypothetical protein CVO96_05675 [Deinococcus koreensis]
MRTDFFASLDRSDPPAPWPEAPGFAPLARTVGPWQVRFRAADTAVFGRPEAGLLVLLKGSLYGTGPGGLLDLYQRHGAEFPRHLEGSFAALLLDERAGRVLAVTDRTGSHALYAAHEGERVLISTRPDWTPLRERPLSVAGVSSFLTKGNLTTGLSLYEGVSTLRRACVHELSPQGLCAHGYWPLNMGEATDLRPSAELEAELVELLRGAAQRRMAASGARPFLSLSGGYDSRGLLRLMADSGREFQTFSYALPRRAAGSDPQVAARLAAQYGVQHTVLQAYRGDLPAHLRRNVAWGGGGAPLCDEADAWAEFAALNPSDVFVGDHAFDLSGHPLTGRADQFLRQKVPPSFEVLSWLRGSLPEPTYAALRDSWNATLETMRVQAGAGPGRCPGGYQLEVALMLDVNVAHSLLPWRDRYAGHLAEVHLPYLDGALLDFIGRIPLELLARKMLFRRALQQLDPQLMQVPLARSLGYVPDWKLELIRQRGVVWEAVQAQSSPLDELIPPQVIHGLLMGLTPTPRGVVWRAAARQTLGRLRRTPLGIRLLGPAPMRKTVDTATFLRRVLVLRELTAARPAPQDSPPALV